MQNGGWCKSGAKLGLQIFWGYKQGVDLGFLSSGGGGGGANFQKEIENFDDLFFLGRPNWFFELSQSTVLPIFRQNFVRRSQILKKVKKAFLGTFWEILTKKLRFFGACSPLKISKYWRRKAPLEKF